MIDPWKVWPDSSDRASSPQVCIPNLKFNLKLNPLEHQLKVTDDPGKRVIRPERAAWHFITHPWLVLLAVYASVPVPSYPL